LYADYFRTSTDQRCLEACGMKKNWAMIEKWILLEATTTFAETKLIIRKKDNYNMILF
jgi:hypothetical protein